MDGTSKGTVSAQHEGGEDSDTAAGAGRLVVVSNRVAKLRKNTQTGGLAVALVDAMRERGGLWFGWSGDIAEAGAPRHDVEGNLETLSIPLSRQDYDGYYLGYGNNVLWPLFHYRLDLVRYSDASFAAYRRVNEAFARALLPQLRPGDRIWVHDYHLIPLAWELRRLGCTAPIGFFLHIPFPPADIFASAPDSAWLTEALLHYDVIGLQTQGYLENLLGYFRRLGGDASVPGRIEIDGRSVAVGAFPIGIDVAAFQELARSKAKDVSDDHARRRLLGRKQIVGVDRLDYSKGLPERLRAFGHLLERNEDFHQKVTLMQIAPRTREGLAAYAEIRAEVESLAGSINGRFSDLAWQPVRFIERSVSRRKLAVLFRTSEVGLVTPLRDGMNLVAKEYVAAQDPEDPGVLVLSQFAGAAEELGDALIVNPLDTEATAQALQHALEMSLAERQRRHEILLASIERLDCHAWLRAFLERLDGVTLAAAPTHTSEGVLPALTQAHRAFDEPDHGVGLGEVTPELAARRIDVLG